MRLPSGRTATAGLQVGNHQKPTVLVLHGFLQTRTFPTVVGVAEALAANGHTVLTPTLSLGISSRKNSLPCEAIHLHDFDSDVDEVEFWVRWLVAKGHKRITLVGHSFGNLHLLAYLARKTVPEVRQSVMISLADVESRQNAASRSRLAADLRARVGRKDANLVEAEFGHCKKYVSTPSALLSYISITRTSLLGWLGKSSVPVDVIMGGNDERMGPGWIDKLSTRSDAVQIIPGANHFFDNQFEFDLQDAVVHALTRTQSP